MKVDIEVRDELYAELERAARERGVSVDEVLQLCLEQYLTDDQGIDHHD